jgi:phosphoribosylaminoimidazole carboxylase PurE protein
MENFDNFDVALMIGSQSDYPVIEESLKILEKFSISYKLVITSAHRTPERTEKFVELCEDSNVKVFIVAAGAAAHLPGVVASMTNIPVIGVPVAATALNGTDALFSIVQMPGGIPVATMAIGKAGAKNAAIFALQIISLSNAELKLKLKNYRVEMKNSIIEQSKGLKIKNQNIFVDFE